MISHVNHVDDSYNLTHVRAYWNKRAPRSPPTKPLSFDFSGDLTLSVGDVDCSQPKLGFEGLPEFENADDTVKKLFSLEFGTKADITDKIVDNLIAKVQDHPLDIQSLEVGIARYTVHIRNGIKHCLQFRNDKFNKVKLIKRILKRRVLLRKLREYDIEKFNWLVNELQIHLRLDPKPKILSRREVREKAAREATEAMIKQKTEELKQRLAIEKAAFDKYRDAELADIERSLSELGISEMTSFESTMAALGFSSLVPKPEPPMSFEERVQRKKVEQLMQKKKETDAEILRKYGFIVPKSLLQ